MASINDSRTRVTNIFLSEGQVCYHAGGTTKRQGPTTAKMVSLTKESVDHYKCKTENGSTYDIYITPEGLDLSDSKRFTKEQQLVPSCNCCGGDCCTKFIFTIVPILPI